jgi:hypothetical protein
MREPTGQSGVPVATLVKQRAMPITYRLICVAVKYHMIDTHLQHRVVSSAHTGVESWAIHYAAPTYRTPLQVMGPHLKSHQSKQMRPFETPWQQVETASPQSSIFSWQLMKMCRSKPVFISAVCNLRGGGHSDIIPVDVFFFLDLYGNNNLSKVVLPMVSQEWDGTPFSGSRTS